MQTKKDSLAPSTIWQTTPANMNDQGLHEEEYQIWEETVVQHLAGHNKASEWYYKFLGNYAKDVILLEDPINHQAEYDTRLVKTFSIEV